MMPAPAVALVERFRAVIARRLGLYFDAAKTARLEEVFDRLATAEGAESYLSRLERIDALAPRAQHEELRALARELTIQETYFFRHLEQFRAFAEVALPRRLAARAPDGRMHILCAGCATGEEPYSLAIVVRESGLAEPGRVTLRAVDVSPEGFEKSALGLYSAWSLRETPDDLRKRWFAPAGRSFHLDPAVKAAVTFEERNLARDDPGLWPRGFYDVVFCRNVMMYFTPDAARALLARIAGAMAPGGYLFLGHAETVRGLSDDFEVRNTHGAFYYERKGGGGEPRAIAPRQDETPRSSVVSAPSSPAPGPRSDWNDEWFAAVERSAERIRTLVETSASRGAPAPASSPVALDPALEGLKTERYAEALEFLRGLPPDQQANPDVVLLRAVLLLHAGVPRQAEEACRQLLAGDASHAGAHHVLSLCRESTGDGAAARRYDEAAVSLDPGFAMAHLHLGLMARKAGDREGARESFHRALERIEREDGRRLLLFGGGFGRDGLAALCRAELHALGGRR
jgi:chemotaxis protein methyltransferase CheR